MREPSMEEILLSIRLMTRSDVDLNGVLVPANKARIEKEIARLLDPTSLDYNPAVANFLRNQYKERQIPKEVVEKRERQREITRNYEAEQFAAQMKLRNKFILWACILGLCGLPFGFLPGLVIFAVIMFCAPNPEQEVRDCEERRLRCCHA